MSQESYSIEVLPISGSKAACVCAVKGDVVYEHPHGAYLSQADARDAANGISVDDCDIEGSWQLISC